MNVVDNPKLEAWCKMHEIKAKIKFLFKNMLNMC